MDLHYSQTLKFRLFQMELLESPMDLHYSQTMYLLKVKELMLESPMDLHYSQTGKGTYKTYKSLNPLWIYTTLKRPTVWLGLLSSLNPLWIYTTLKH